MVLLQYPEYILALQALISNDRALIISLPRKFDALNITDVDNLYLEVWGIAPEGIVESVKTSIDPKEPIIKLSAKSLENIVKKWIELYRNYGKYWKPALILQISAYSGKQNVIVHLFGASIVYDPEIFVDKLPRVEIHKIELDNFLIKNVIPINNRSRQTTSLTPCINMLTQNKTVFTADQQIQSQSGLPPICRPGNCDCCDPNVGLYVKYAIIGKIFDSSDSNVPEYLRDKIPIVIAYRDPSSTSGGTSIWYEIQSVDKVRFRITFLDINLQITLFANPSGELIPGQLGYAVPTYPGKVVFGYWYGSYKLYEVIGYTCCLVRGCSDSYYQYCEPNGAHGLMMVVTYIQPDAMVSEPLSLSDFPIDIDYFKQKKPYTSMWLNLNSITSLDRDPYDIRLNMVNIAMAAALAKAGVPWYADVLLSVAVDNMPIAAEFLIGGGIQETLRISNGANSRYIDIFYQDAIYAQTMTRETFKWIFIYVR